MWIIFVWTKPSLPSLPPHGSSCGRRERDTSYSTLDQRLQESGHQLTGSTWSWINSVYPILLLRAQPTFPSSARPWQPTRFYYCLWCGSVRAFVWFLLNKTKPKKIKNPCLAYPSLGMSWLHIFQLSINRLRRVFAADQLPMAGNDPDLGRANIKCTDRQGRPQWGLRVKHKTSTDKSEAFFVCETTKVETHQLPHWQKDTRTNNIDVGQLFVWRMSIFWCKKRIKE